jgi:hypothetical protein
MDEPPCATYRSPSVLLGTLVAAKVSDMLAIANSGTVKSREPMGTALEGNS